MGVVPLFLTVVLYAWLAVDLQIYQRDWPMAGAFTCYAIANLFFIAGMYRNVVERLLSGIFG